MAVERGLGNAGPFDQLIDANVADTAVGKKLVGSGKDPVHWFTMAGMHLFRQQGFPGCIRCTHQKISVPWHWQRQTCLSYCFRNMTPRPREQCHLPGPQALLQWGRNRRAMMDEDIRAVEDAVATLESARLEHDPAAISLQNAVAAAVTHGKPIREVAAAAHMTALEVLDAADAVTYPQQALQASTLA